MDFRFEGKCEIDYSKKYARFYCDNTIIDYPELNGWHIEVKQDCKINIGSDCLLICKHDCDVQVKNDCDVNFYGCGKLKVGDRVRITCGPWTELEVGNDCELYTWSDDKTIHPKQGKYYINSDEVICR